MRVFSGKAVEAESTVLPSITSWIEETLHEIPEVRSSEDHGLVIWVNLPSAGILTVNRYEYVVTSVTNLLAIYRKNGIALLIHPNRASQYAERTPFQVSQVSLVTLVPIS